MCGVLSEAEKELLRGIQFPLPPFHQHCHEAGCQAKHAPHLYKGAGTAVGEPPEAFWALLGRMVYRVAYMRMVRTCVFEFVRCGALARCLIARFVIRLVCVY